ncbi:hypothetical protein H261_05234 [Paramagnetospirillum caucaseum]|uniref:Uncharacterized protein n=1 Tax=Paramagnetospirillum caucaseum TaxID=1244869 RepID=M3AEI5_9PROT|nr:hypothetical protein [Paramagnetospirillum caucaseum]EME70964.1 hypothetical protein H261_05234 [Paramagnetospirillum caucaseum]
MDHSWDEIDQLTEILEAEAAGDSVNTGKACELAGRLMESCPEIACSLGLILSRFQTR